MSRILVIGTFDSVSCAIGERLTAAGVAMEYAAGNADALQRLRLRSFGVVITCPETPVDDDLALLEEMRLIRPGVKCIVLTPRSTPEEIIAALRARVFACFSEPYSVEAIADLAQSAASSSDWRDEIYVVSARAGWVTVRVNCQMLTADRLLTFARELNARLPSDELQDMIRALREILLNAMEHGTAFNPDQTVEMTAVRTARSLVFHIRDPGPGFRRGQLAEGGIANPLEDPLEHIRRREEAGIRPGGYGVLLAGNIVDELIYNESGNEVVLIKYLDRG
ncbi:MAG: ATP-binding protein [Edaphobacter sp.]|uniref:ATP-binding response regulator n=1 Tax=Edaphobacter sp. TaxID=1934404 RepID=UPI002398C2DE|nr:ATP-binding protein [Edaphobacter sp.]MDE1178771.1 ATP-binding protein [Edaphobacter sp.]